MLLLVDAEEAQCRFVASLAARGGWRTLLASDTESAIATLGTHDGLLLDAVLIDSAVAGDNLSAVIAAMRDWRPSLPILFLGEAAGRSASLGALRAGASDFLDKPLTAERLHQALDQAISPHFSGELRPLSEKFVSALAVEEMVGSTPAFRTALAIAAKAARTRVPVLIEGEPGTGKALVAEAMHHAGLRPRTPFITVDCGHHSDAMIAPLLFGYERGAFAGAFERRIGEIAKAEGGTLVLDRIERLPLDAQALLADMLDTGRARTIGGTVDVPVDIRLVSCATTSLKQRTRDGMFREDLLARISVAEVSLPPLRERRVDIAALARHFTARIGALPGMHNLSLSGDLIDALGHWRWPGNVRQLHDALLRAACTATGPQLSLADFPGLSAERARAPEDLGYSNPMPSDGIGVTLYRADGNLRPLADIEADVIRLAIGHYRGRMSEVARRLGIGRSTLYRKLADLGIDTAA
ncbi:MAG: sigma-54 dependent transcriptional regulator [Sphingopyxis sp.]|nr:sigma-54 dependent transcriptional regulator [Sphingopyxis sp.]